MEGSTAAGGHAGSREGRGEAAENSVAAADDDEDGEAAAGAAMQRG
ncbi:hypothetical protein EE612_029867 [Oryza sativa]|nr:hypothetical protein EE612_029867 [Oryza sativa]